MMKKNIGNGYITDLLEYLTPTTLPPSPSYYTSNGWCYLIVTARHKLERFSFKQDNGMLNLGSYYINKDVLSVFI